MTDAKVKDHHLSNSGWACSRRLLANQKSGYIRLVLTGVSKKCKHPWPPSFLVSSLGDMKLQSVSSDRDRYQQCSQSFLHAVMARLLISKGVSFVRSEIFSRHGSLALEYDIQIMECLG